MCHSRAELLFPRRKVMIRNCCQRAAGIFRRLCPKWCRLEMSSANLRFWWTLRLLLKSQQSSSIHVVCMVIKSPLWCSMKNSLHAGERSNELKVWETSPVCRVNKGDRSLSVLSRRWQKVPEEVSFFLSFFFYACLNASVPQCCRRWFTIGRPLHESWSRAW